MAAVHEDDDDGASAAVVAIFLVVLIVILAILFYGLSVGHWFAGSNPSIINPPSNAPSIAASASSTR